MRLRPREGGWVGESWIIRVTSSAISIQDSRIPTQRSLTTPGLWNQPIVTVLRNISVFFVCFFPLSEERHRVLIWGRKRYSVLKRGLCSALCVSLPRSRFRKKVGLEGYVIWNFRCIRSTEVGVPKYFV